MSDYTPFPLPARVFRGRSAEGIYRHSGNFRIWRRWEVEAEVDHLAARFYRRLADRRFALEQGANR